MAYIHGGGFIGGDAYDETSNHTGTYNATHIVQQFNVIVVSIQYRLNVFGFLAIPELQAETSQNTTGNYGSVHLCMFSFVLSIIVSSIGCKTNVLLCSGCKTTLQALAVILSVSCCLDRAQVDHRLKRLVLLFIMFDVGGASVCYHFTSPASAGLFSAILAQSPLCSDPSFFQPVESAFNLGNAFVKHIGCGDGALTLDCLRKLPTEDVLNLFLEWAKEFDIPAGTPLPLLLPIMPWVPVIDGSEVCRSIMCLIR